jgi:hypothetical protein
MAARRIKVSGTPARGFRKTFMPRLSACRQ